MTENPSKMAAGVLRSVVILLFFGTVSYGLSARKVTTFSFPNCDENKQCIKAREAGNVPNVVYTKASTPSNDNLYYAFSTLELPTIVIAHTTGSDSDMIFDWDIILNQNSLIDAISFTFPNKIHLDYKLGITFTKLIEYDDIHDDADIDEAKKHKDFKCTTRYFNDSVWDTLPMNLNSSFIFNSPDNMSNNGSLSFSFRNPSEDGRESELPAQRYTVNETIFDFLLQNFTPSYTHSRFALEFVSFSLHSSKKMDVDTVETIDDEYSPGVFLLTNLLTNPSDNSKSGFMQWKPICYLSESRGRKTSTKVKHYKLEDLDETDKTFMNSTLVAGLFGKDLYDGETEIKKLIVSFGLPKDGFYLKNNYTIWTGAIGYGTPPKDEISTTVIIIISAGLGLPVLLIIFGGVFTVVRKIKKKKSEYSPINGRDTVSQSVPRVN